MRLEKFVPPLRTLKVKARKALIEAARLDRATSKAIKKQTTRKQRVTTMGKLEGMLASMSEKERNAFLERMKE